MPDVLKPCEGCATWDALPHDEGCARASTAARSAVDVGNILSPGDSVDVKWLQWQPNRLAVGTWDRGVALRFGGPPADLVLLPDSIAGELLDLLLAAAYERRRAAI